MDEWFLGEIRMFAGGFAPSGWELCDGRELSQAGHAALYSLILGTYGQASAGNFKLPDLRGRVPLHMGTGRDMTRRGMGESLGTETVTLTDDSIPRHTHNLMTLSAKTASTIGWPEGMMLASSTGFDLYHTPDHTAVMDMVAIKPPEGHLGKPHSNMMPTLAINFIIATTGMYPSQTGE
jgi:microcystin-dependent protein